MENEPRSDQPEASKDIPTPETVARLLIDALEAGGDTADKTAWGAVEAIRRRQQQEKGQK